jgi:hypothetical protein
MAKAAGSIRTAGSRAGNRTDRQKALIAQYAQARSVGDRKAMDKVKQQLSDLAFEGTKEGAERFSAQWRRSIQNNAGKRRNARSGQR